MLLCLSSRQRRSVFEEAVEAAGEVALEAAAGFAAALAFLGASFDVGDRVGVGAAAGGASLDQGVPDPRVPRANPVPR